MVHQRIAVLVKGYPRLSETFIAQELVGLERRGLPLLIVSLRHPTDPAVHDLHRQIRADVLYLPEYLYQEPVRVLRALGTVARGQHFRAALRLWRADLRRDRTANRVRRFGQALVLAAELPRDVGLLYVHYLHTPASVGRYAGILTELGVCISAHAKDIWTTPAWEKREKLQACRWLTTCTRAGAAHLEALAPTAPIMLARHGLDAGRFPSPHRSLGPDGSDPSRPVRLLGVARLVPKKGVDITLSALASLPPSIFWRYDHIGGGAALEALQLQAETLGIADRVRWLGALPQDRVLEAYRSADLFVLASRVAADGDRDGLPNVLLEAGSQELALIATPAGAIPELIEDGRDGRLVPEDDPAALSDVLAELIKAPETRLILGQRARMKVLAEFRVDEGLDRIAARLRAELEREQVAAA